MTQHPVAAICRTLRMARQTAYYAARVRPAGFYRRLDDETVVQQPLREELAKPRTRQPMPLSDLAGVL